MSQKRGFTLVELLVVIAIIGLLLTFLMPSLNLAREQAKAVVCSAQLKGVGLGVTAYLADNDDRLPYAPNHGRWDDLGPNSGNTGEQLAPDSPHAYWGIAYIDYIQDRKAFSCPAQKHVDDWWEHHAYYLYENSTYGLNSYVDGMRLADFRHPDEVIFCQDHVEQLVDDVDHDHICFSPSQNIDTYQWRFVYANHWPDAVQECFRHKWTERPRVAMGGYQMQMGYGYCNTLWLDGHVSAIPGGNTEDSKDIPQRWFDPSISRN